MLGENAAPFDEVPEDDRDWNDADWAYLLDWLIETGLVSAKEVTALVLGHLNPSQVGTSIASKPTWCRKPARSG